MHAQTAHEQPSYAIQCDHTCSSSDQPWSVHQASSDRFRSRPCDEIHIRAESSLPDGKKIQIKLWGAVYIIRRFDFTAVDIVSPAGWKWFILLGGERWPRPNVSQQSCGNKRKDARAQKILIPSHPPPLWICFV